MRIFLLSIVFLSTLFSQNLVEEKSLIKGKLDNGFKYTIKQHSKPAQKAQLKLVVKIGALEEDEDQQGLAHFLEHMAFNGTKHFEKNTLISYLESIGVPFGQHLNASTGTNRTQYDLTIPIENNNLDKALLIFKDWASNISFDEKEVQKEKGVVLEEKRKRNDLFFRLSEKRRVVLYENTKYAKRNIIGSQESIENLSLKRIKDFYKNWYRPEFMHFIAVGDFKNPKEFEKKIKKTFSSLTNNSKRQRASRNITLDEKRKFIFSKEKELTSNSLSFYFLQENHKAKSVEDLKQNFLKQFAIGLFNTQNSNLIAFENPIAKKIKAQSFELGNNAQAVFFKAQYQGMKELEVLKQLVNSIYTIKKYGFDKNSFEVLKKSLIKTNALSLQRSQNASSLQIANALAKKAVFDEIVIHRKFKYEILKEFIPSITLKDLQKTFISLIDTKSQIIEYNLKNSNTISKRAINKAIKEAKNNLKKPKQKTKLAKKILKTAPKELKIKKEIYNKEFDFWELTLANDTKIIFKKNSIDKDEVFLHSFSNGGFSLVNDEDFLNAKYVADTIKASGIKEFSAKQLSLINAQKSFSVDPYISRYAQGFTAQSSKTDFKSMLEMIYLYHTRFTIDETILKNKKLLFEYSLRQSSKTPQVKFLNDYLEFYYQGNKRFTQDLAKDIKKLNKDKMLQIFKERFEAANNFVYIIIGDIDYKSVKKYASIYLANLPVKKKNESFINRNKNYLKGKQEFVRNYENKNISTLSYSYFLDLPYSKKEYITLFALRNVLHVKLRELIREEKSGAYDISVNADFVRVPTQKASITFTFSCDPKRVSELKKDVSSIISKLKTQKVEQQYINAYVKRDLHALKQSVKQNLFWMRHLKDYANFNDDLNEINKYKSYYNSLTKKDILEASKRYLKDENLIYSELNPIK